MMSSCWRAASGCAVGGIGSAARGPFFPSDELENCLRWLSTEEFWGTWGVDHGGDFKPLNRSPRCLGEKTGVPRRREMTCLIHP